MIKLVLADMDNTLVPFGRSTVSRRTLSAIRACQKAGVVFAPASGRNLAEVAGFLCHDTASYETAVLVNGQQVYLRGRLVREARLDPSAVARAEELISGRPGCALLVYRPDGFCDWVGDDPENLGNFVEDAMRGGSLRHDRLPHYPVVKAGIIALLDHGGDLALRSELVDICPELDFMNTVRCWFDVVPHGWSKVRGIEVLELELGITPDEICAFGDAENDLPMFAHVKHACAVANAVPAVKEAATWQVGASADNGVAIALEQIAAATLRSRETGRECLPAFMTQG